jgi:hypothetical protein
MMGGTIDRISTARNLEITIEGGRVREGNFDSYPLLGLQDAPDVEVIIVPSERDPAGAGEMGIPTAAPALANALYAATGKRIRSLPIRSLPARGHAGENGRVAPSPASGAGDHCHESGADRSQHAGDESCHDHGGRGATRASR